MWFTRSDTGFRGWFIITDNFGALAPNLLSSHFTCSLRTPSDTSGSMFAVTQSGKPGLYRFDVTSQFLLATGYGQYGVVIEMNSGSVSDALAYSMCVTADDFSSLSGSIWNASASFSTSGTMGELQSRLNATVASRAAAGAEMGLLTGTMTSLIDGIWDEQVGQHLLSGSAGDTIYSGSSGQVSASVSVDNAAVAAAVWDRSLGLHQTSGSAGWVLERMTVVSASVDFMHAIQGGRWRMDTGSYEMIMYREDNSTEVARFSLHDSAGAPSFTNPFERRRT